MFYRWNGKEEIKLEVKKEVAILIASIVNSKKFLKIIKEQEGEKVIMCTSLDLFAKRNRKAGFNEGKNVGKKVGLDIGKREGRNEGKKTMLIESVSYTHLDVYKRQILNSFHQKVYFSVELAEVFV